ncbi:hypothetical protein RND71_026710 [Anisodus tanguticus]|uniref:Uncharacterized protein n=1 Tax=Anisodus tanguticus TaxID=243964 RepID=A0AAE1RP56_9SOLA|nr:hypothetical protein RND71_026710 [Anisodus tanguticus]
MHDNVKAKKIDTSLMPSRLMQRIREVRIYDILDNSLANLSREKPHHIVTWPSVYTESKE